LFYFSFILAVILFILPIYSHDLLLALVPAIFFLFPVLFIFAKAVEESCMIVLINPRKLTEGDWLYEKVKVGRKIVRPNWEGLSQEELILLRRYKRKIKVKQGIPFVPAFFFAFILLLFKDNIFNLLFIFT